MRKILFSLLAIGAVGAIVTGGTIAYLSDSESSHGNTYSLGTVEISVNQELHWSHSLVWENFEPGDSTELTLLIKNEGVNPVKIWQILKCFTADENGVAEPESEWYATYNNGQPKNDLDTAVVFGLTVNGKTAVAKEAGVTLAEIKNYYLNLKKNDPESDPSDNGILSPGETLSVVHQYHLPLDTPNWAQSDKLIFTIELDARQAEAGETEIIEPVSQMSFIDNKVTSGSWPVIVDQRMGILKYDYLAQTFNYNFLGLGLEPTTEYCLIYYAAGWPGNHPGYYFASGYPDDSGRLNLTGSPDVGMDLPAPTDTNIAYSGAKIWLVPCVQYDRTARSVIGWSPNSQWLFENWPGLISYKQGDRPDEVITCDYAPITGGTDASCVDADADGYGSNDDRSSCVYPELDCDDGNAAINPGAAEICFGGLDEDCNGEIDGDDVACSARTPLPGELVIDEIMADPAAVSDDKGEWLELYNSGNTPLDLFSCSISDSVNTDNHDIVSHLIVAAHDYVVLGVNNNPALNGGLTVDYQYSGFELYNAEDQVILTCAGQEIDRVEYDSSFPLAVGQSMVLSDEHDNNSLGSNWCLSGSSYGAGDKGTPGTANDVCSRAVVLNLSDLGADPQYGYVHDYSTAAVSFSYTTPVDGNLTGQITATGLKPYATYQLKFEAIPTCRDAVNGDDELNETLGYLGRWWNYTDEQNNSDADYESNVSDCIAGYLVWDHVTADASGAVTKSVSADNSYHVLWCAGGVCDTANNSYLGFLDPAYPSVNFCPADKVNGELEHFSCGGLSLPAGDYNLQLILNEESFHQGPGTWTAVMSGDITFEIE